MTLIQPLDFETLIIDRLIGTGALTGVLFGFIALAVLAMLAARFRMPGGAFLMMIIVFVFLMGSTFLAGTGFVTFALIITIIGVTLLIGWRLNRGFS